MGQGDRRANANGKATMVTCLKLSLNSTIRLKNDCTHPCLEINGWSFDFSLFTGTRLECCRLLIRRNLDAMFLTKFATPGNGYRNIRCFQSQCRAKSSWKNGVKETKAWKMRRTASSSTYGGRLRLESSTHPKLPKTWTRLISSTVQRKDVISATGDQKSIQDRKLESYVPPSTGLLSHLPASFVPYAELVRLDKPTGTYYLFFPCLFSTLLAAPLCDPMPPPSAIVGTSLLFLTGALIMRGAGCAINDLWDRNLDPYVSRTRLRPIARGALSPQSAIIFTGVQLLTGLAVLLQFPTQCLYYGVPSLLLVATYPLAKRVTYYPQFVLGLTFSWGAIMGFSALGIDLISNSTALTSAALLYSSCVAWTVLYDMIYAHMDIKDDVKAGIKSIALAHETNTKAVLTGLAVTQVGLLAAAGVAIGASPVFFAGSCGSAVASLGLMIWKVDLKSVASCWW